MKSDWIEAEQDTTREWQVRQRGKTKIEGQIAGRREWDGYCVGSVEFCTNGPQGGDAGWGGFLRVTFTTLHLRTWRWRWMVQSPQLPIRSQSYFAAMQKLPLLSNPSNF